MPTPHELIALLLYLVAGVVFATVTIALPQPIRSTMAPEDRFTFGVFTLLWPPFLAVVLILGAFWSLCQLGPWICQLRDRLIQGRP